MDQFHSKTQRRVIASKRQYPIVSEDTAVVRAIAVSSLVLIACLVVQAIASLTGTLSVLIF
jgi:hypothetical protein